MEEAGKVDDCESEAVCTDEEYEPDEGGKVGEYGLAPGNVVECAAVVGLIRQRLHVGARFFQLFGVKNASDTVTPQVASSTT